MLIKHPRPDLGRQKAFGVEFIDGVARVDELHPERELALRQHGFTIEDEWVPCGRGPCAANDGHAGTCAEASGWADDDVTEFVDLETMSKQELIDYADRVGVELPKRANREQIIWILSSDPADPVDNPNAIQEG